ncbi:MSHA pilin protein MshC [Pseudidiomarina planktonica]|uniref:MSHA pilin protein MshC n=1 Tax=Pseudidiomarina planktonica TaxID=1323738 RepID=A0A1Y6EGP7_9GAMM|nr:prepilin-type N-terminal cleavage/methylation domain-containing protein [Pseudidiomarina planktonica]RUO66118.1 type II secretion system protein [Pseudidiomarina planktonica]SMQ60331.1 MSHA pilin protein MshC [Pseudidiomarina planktonica]
MRIQQGFTIIELVAVIVVIGILAVTAAPAFFSDDGADVQTYQARLINLLRLQQQRAMQDTASTNNYCVLIAGNRFGVPTNCSDTSLPASFDPDYEGLAAAEQDAGVTITPAEVRYFNGLGCPVSAPGNACGTAPWQITIAGGNNLQVCVASQGRIHRGVCE